MERARIPWVQKPVHARTPQFPQPTQCGQRPTHADKHGFRNPCVGAAETHAHTHKQSHWAQARFGDLWGQLGHRASLPVQPQDKAVQGCQGRGP